MKRTIRKIEQEKLVLASASPRRKQLLEQIGLSFKVCPANLDESKFNLPTPKKLAETLSLEKASCVAKQYVDSWVIGSDTIVVVGDKVLGKPNSMEDAIDMLNLLSDVEHSVITGFSLINELNNVRTTHSVETKVRFNSLSEDEISWYVNTNEPYDKAGGYGIQGKAAWMIQSITGSYTNVMGLPLGEVVNSLLKFGVIKFGE